MTKFFFPPPLLHKSKIEFHLSKTGGNFDAIAAAAALNGAGPSIFPSYFPLPTPPALSSILDANTAAAVAAAAQQQLQTDIKSESNDSQH